MQPNDLHRIGEFVIGELVDVCLTVVFHDEPSELDASFFSLRISPAFLLDIHFSIQ
jgi:hypothetical protein